MNLRERKKQKTSDGGGGGTQSVDGKSIEVNQGTKPCQTKMVDAIRGLSLRHKNVNEDES